MIERFKNHYPLIHETAFVHPSAIVIGHVVIDEGASVWPGVVLRGDMGLIKIGKNTSIQDNTVCHMTLDFSHTIVGDNVTVGHSVILHGCVIEDNCLIGMGSTILDQTVIGKDSFVAAGSLVTGNKTFEAESFIAGHPAKFIRRVNDKEKMMCFSSVKHYLDIAEEYRKQMD